MNHIKVADLMTDEAVSPPRAATLIEVVKVLAQCHVSGVPALDEEGRVVGVISQSDVLALTSSGPHPQDAVHAAPLTAGEIMSSPAVTIHAEETAADAARLLTRRDIERLPVVDVEDRLVGIVTRRDLLRMFLRPDGEIRRRALDVLTDVLAASASSSASRES